MRVLLILAVAIASIVTTSAVEARHTCSPQPPNGGGVVWVPPSSGCAGASVNLGSDVQCARGAAVEVANVWASVAGDGGCETGAAVALP